MASVGSANKAAIRKASGRLGSYLPVSMALTLWRETSRRSARSAWLQSRSARRTFSRFFITATPSPAHAPGPARGQALADAEQHEDVGERDLRQAREVLQETPASADGQR